MRFYLSAIIVGLVFLVLAVGIALLPEIRDRLRRPGRKEIHTVNPEREIGRRRPARPALTREEPNGGDPS